MELFNQPTVEDAAQDWLECLDWDVIPYHNQELLVLV